MELNLDALAATAGSATPGPWRWEGACVPELIGRAGEEGVYQYDSTVIEASHWGECGCRASCELELTVNDADKAYLAAAYPDVILALIERVRTAEATLAERERRSPA